MNNFFSSFFDYDKSQAIYDIFTSNNFDKHIKKSIPYFYKTQLFKINYLRSAKNYKVLDIGGTSGALCKTISLTSYNKTFNLDPSEEILFFNLLIPVINYQYINKSFEDLEVSKYDVINETMTFQFINKNRSYHLLKVNRLLDQEGELFIEEKVKTKFFYINEIINFIRKLFLFSPITNFKKIKIVKKMNKNLITEQYLSDLIDSHWKYKIRYYKKLNFVGYYATNSENKFNNFINEINNL